MIDDRLLSRAQVRKYLGISKGTLAKLVEDGDLPEIRISERICRIRESDLDRMLKGASRAE